jgi:hypothetical protein
MCLQQGRIRAATIVDHINPHAGDRNAFFLGKVQSLCAEHHDGEKRVTEQRGYSDRIGADGWPTDPRHPIYRT